MQQLLKKNIILRKQLYAGLFVFLFFLLLTSGFQIAIANGAVKPLVETEWLAKNLKNELVRIVHVGTPAPDSPQKFNMKHIPGSVYLAFNTVIDALAYGQEQPPAKAKFEALMSALGINNNQHVVIAGGRSSNPFTYGIFWLMEYFGHEKVSYLNGGIMKWVREKRPMTGNPTKITPTKYNAKAPNESIYASADHVMKNLKNAKVVLLDVRSPAEFTGKDNTPQNKRLGHIPGAVNINFFPTNFGQDGRFKSANALKSIYESRGVTSDKEVIVYCQGGIRAGAGYIALKYILGYPNVKNYVGSWDEWGNRTQNPISQ